MPLKNAILPGESAITLSTSIVSPDGLKIGQSAHWIIEIGNGKSTESHKRQNLQIFLYDLKESNIPIVSDYVIAEKALYILVVCVSNVC